MSDLSSKAAAVAETYAAHEVAQLNERAAQAEALKAAVEAVGPALPAMSSLIEHSHVAAQCIRGVCLDRVLGRAKIVLCVNGEILLEGESGWVPIRPSIAVQQADVGAMVQVLDEALERQLRGKLRERTAEINGRAAKLRAILAVLK